MALPKISDEDAAAARELRIRLIGLVSLQLIQSAGNEESIMADLAQISPIVQRLVISHQKALAFEIVATFFLERLLHPNLNRWQALFINGGLRDEAARHEFRGIFQVFQQRLKQFESLLASFANSATDTNDKYQELEKIVPSGNRPYDLGQAIEAGIGDEVAFKSGLVSSELLSGKNPLKFATAEDINKAEAAFILKRRSALDNRTSDSEPASHVSNAVGLCLSGGGIRSATFCLGIVQVLARQGLLQQIDYVSTVSGGGYLGAFLSSFLGNPLPKTEKPDPKTDNPAPNRERPDSEVDETGDQETSFLRDDIDAVIKEAFYPDDRPESRAVRHLRNNSHYLFKGDLWSTMKLVGLLVSGILTNLLLFVPLPLLGVFIFLLFDCFEFWGHFTLWNGDYSKPAEWLICKAGFFLGCFLLAAWLLLPIARNLATGEEVRSKFVKLRTAWEVGTLVLAAALVIFACLFVLPWAFPALEYLAKGFSQMRPNFLHEVEPSALLAGLSGLAPILLGLLSAGARDGVFKKIAGILFALSGPIFYLAIFFLVTQRILHGDFDSLYVFLVMGILIFWGFFCVDINNYSPHVYYRNRICECYLAARKNDQTGAFKQLCQRVLHGRIKNETIREVDIGALRQLPLSEMNKTGAAPYHLVHAALNLPASVEPNLRGRDCDFFSFGRDFCGGPISGYIPTKVLEKLDPHVDLGTAVAISGAAASANMGVKTMKKYRFLLALLNIRLGYWLRNPTWGFRNFLNLPGPAYFFLEMFGWMHEKWPYLNLSDGGHIENLALYEMLRRRCKFIIAVDGGMEPGMECADLMLAQRYARIDLGTEIEIDLAPLGLNAGKATKAYASFGKIHYWKRPDDAPGSTPIGFLIYLKLAWTGGEPGYVQEYRRQFPDFPHQSTNDQLYDEAQFEAYRRLGETAATSLFKEDIVDTYYQITKKTRPQATSFGKIEHWYEALATSLLIEEIE